MVPQPFFKSIQVFIEMRRRVYGSFGFVTVLEGVHIVFRAPFMHYVRLKGVRVLESF